MKTEDCRVCNPPQVDLSWEHQCPFCERQFPYKWMLQVHELTYGAKGGWCPPNRYSWTRR